MALLNTTMIYEDHYYKNLVKTLHGLNYVWLVVLRQSVPCSVSQNRSISGQYSLRFPLICKMLCQIQIVYSQRPHNLT